MSFGSILYQILHPWHWLTYGQNTAALGLIGLVVYTIDTRRMRLLGERTRRAELFPFLVIRASEDQEEQNHEITIANLGGALVHSTIWAQTVSSSFRLNLFYLERKEEIPSRFSGYVRRDATQTLVTEEEPGSRTLYVVEGVDMAGGRHQFCILRDRTQQGVLSTEFQMTGPSDF